MTEERVYIVLMKRHEPVDLIIRLNIEIVRSGLEENINSRFKTRCRLCILIEFVRRIV